jgi:hypothetical protein
MFSVTWEYVGGWSEKWSENEKSYCSLALITPLRAVRKEMGILFLTIP